MPGQKISSLPPVNNLLASDEFPLSRSASTFKIKGDQFASKVQLDSLSATVDRDFALKTDLTNFSSNTVTTINGLSSTVNRDFIKKPVPASAQQVLTYNGSTWVANTLPAGNPGTVTNVTGTLPISVANGSTAPAISIAAATQSAAGTMSSTDKTRLDDASGVNGLVKCNGSGDFSAAAAGTDYLTLGTLPAATQSAAGTMSSTDKTRLDDASGVNGIVKCNGSGDFSAAAVTGTLPISVANGSTAPAISIAAATQSAAGTMSSTDKTRLDDASGVNGIVKCNGSGDFSAAAVTGTLPISVANGSTAPAISIAAATQSAAGTMSSTDKTRLDDASGVTGLVKCNGYGDFSAAAAGTDYLTPDTFANNLPARLKSQANSITDWNNALENGWYMADNAANAPAAGWFLGTVEAHNDAWVTQTVHGFTIDGNSSTAVYRRSRSNSTWESWYLVQLSQAEQDARYPTKDKGFVYGDPSTSWSDAFQVREADLNYNNNLSDSYRPRLAFHWGNVVASSISLRTDGAFSFDDNPGTDRTGIFAGGVDCSWLNSSGTVGGANIELVSDHGNNNGPYIDLKTSGSEDYDCRIRQDQNGLSFETGGNGAAGERMKIQSDGNVGIGTTAPGCKLDVIGGVRARGGGPGANGSSNNGYAFNNPGDNDSGMFSSADGQIEFYSNASEVIRIANSGYVGIGTTTPTAKLDINGDLKIGTLNGPLQATNGVVSVAASNGVPTGAVMYFATNTPPTGWEVCTGGPITNDGVYAALYAVLQAAGWPFGSAKFPDLRGRFIRSFGNDGTYSSGAFGAKQADKIKGHVHVFNDKFRNYTTYGGFSGNVSNTMVILGDTSENKTTNGPGVFKPGTISGADNVQEIGDTESSPANVALYAFIKL